MDLANKISSVLSSLFSKEQNHLIMNNVSKVLSLEKSLKILQKYQIHVPKSKFAKTLQYAINYAKQIGYPVAIKVVSSSITHKTDVGGVQLNIRNEMELKSAYQTLLKNAKRKAPKTKVDGVLVQNMIDGGLEIIIGCKSDEQFGHVIMFGLGGIFTEVFNDVAFRISPINKQDAESMIREIKGYKILQGYRGIKYDIASLTKILLNTSKLLEKNPRIKEIDINPVVVLSKDAIAVDSRIVFE